MHSPYLLVALLPFVLANTVSQISDGQIQEPAEAPAVAAPKIIAVAPTTAPAAAAPPPPTSTSTSTFTPSPKPSPSSTAPALKEAGAIAAPPTANASIPAQARIEEAATTAPILIAPAPAANVTMPPHHANYEAPRPSASVGKVLPVENGTAPTVPVVPTVESPAPTSVEGSPKEAGTTHAVATGVAARVGVSAGIGAFGVVGLAVMLS